MNPPDAELIKKILDGDTGAFDSLYSRYAGKVRSRLKRILREEGVVEDLVQETFLRVWTRAEQWEGRGAFEGWLSRLATNLALNRLRSMRRLRESPLEVTKKAFDAEEDDELQAPSWMVDASSIGADEMVALREERDMVRRLVDRLPEEQREVVRLVIDVEMDIRGVADTLGIPQGTVKSRLHYAKKRLGQEWERSESKSCDLK